MLDRCTEAQRFDASHVSSISVKIAQNMVGTPFSDRAIEHIDVVQLGFLIATANPMQVVQIDGVGDAKVLEGSQELAVDRFRQADFGRDASTEILQNAPAVHALGSSR